jgi:acyl-CoA reductase-like NAD-dependent aldehyde dehydrogenase
MPPARAGQPRERHYYLLDFGAPFGGMKDSGIGRELGPEALNSYLECKSIYASADQLPN